MWVGLNGYMTTKTLKWIKKISYPSNSSIFSPNCVFEITSNVRISRADCTKNLTKFMDALIGLNIRFFEYTIVNSKMDLHGPNAFSVI